MQHKSRPKYINLAVLGPKMSINAKISILHRFSGAILVIAIPFLIYLLDQSLKSKSVYDFLYGASNTIAVKAIYLLLIWALMHHMCSGVRFLFLDIHKGIDIKTAKLTSWVAIVVSLVLTAILGAFVC